MTPTPEQLRIRVAELDGATELNGGVSAYYPEDRMEQLQRLGCATLRSEERPGMVLCEIPHYESSLDACAKGFENGMDLETFAKYWEALKRFTGSGMHSITHRNNRMMLFATPTQRCLAFIEVMEHNKEKEL